jgi:type I restriction enzyme S subunit
MGGILTKQKSMDSEDQMAVNLIDNDLPEGWALPRISDLIELNYGKGLKGADRKLGPVSVYGSNGIVGSHNTALTKGPSIIIGRKGSVGAVHYSPTACWPIDTTYYVDKFNGLNPMFLMYALRLLNLADLDTSTAIPGLNRNDVYSEEIPLPPINEQKRIVAKLEGLLTRVNTTKERLAKVSMILKRFRQAVLAAACSGRLTADWRENNQKDSAEDLILKTLNRRRSQLEINGKVSLRTCYKEPIEPAYHIEFEIPDTWCLATVDQLTLLVTKGSSPKWQGFEYTEGGLPFVRSQNVLWGNLDLSDVAYLPVVFNESHKNSIIRQGDILLNLVGASVGRSSIATEAIEGANCNQAVAIIRLVPDGMLNKFLMYFFVSPYAQEHIHESKADVARANFNLDDIRPMVVPVPPLTEQKEIVRRVESLFKLADAVEKRVATAKAKAEKLTHAILAKAFRGGLVPTEAELAHREARSYEPASDLLARIKSDRESKQASQKVRRNRG